MSCLFLQRYMRFALVFVDKDCETNFSFVQLQLSPVSTKAQRRDCKGQIAGSIWSHRATNFAIRLGWPATTCKLRPWPENIGQLPIFPIRKFGPFLQPSGPSNSSKMLLLDQFGCELPSWKRWQVPNTAHGKAVENPIICRGI